MPLYMNYSTNYAPLYNFCLARKCFEGKGSGYKTFFHFIKSLLELFYFNQDFSGSGVLHPSTTPLPENFWYQLKIIYLSWLKTDNLQGKNLVTYKATK